MWQAVLRTSRAASRGLLPGLAVLGHRFFAAYLIEDNVAIVYRVLDLRQNPESIRGYLKPDVQPEQR